MAKVACFELPGLECVFYSNDHGPPHFHAIKAGAWECRVYFMTEPQLEMKWGNRHVSAGDRRALLGAAEVHRVQLLLEWERIHG